MTRTELPQSDLFPTIDLERLVANSGSENAKLLEACKSNGVFYLDFRNYAATRDIGRQTEAIYAVSDRYFEQPIEVKMKDLRKDQPASSDRGFKFYDFEETFEISHDEMQQGSSRLSGPLAENEPLLSEFHSHCHKASHLILSRLEEALNIPLRSSHRPGQPSETGLKLVAEPSFPTIADVPETKHTDSGTLTFVFYDKWGLQTHLAEKGPEDRTENWAFIPPPAPGCVVVHVANTLQRLSKNQLRSPVHRTSQPEDGQGKRYVLTYFLRPEDAAKTQAVAA
ncbi:hypothetical protein ETB97_008560 [Aspergillus alliaceus]|uniref:Isopenicillin N synthase-like Fe(2+) 2OG dioxygenase domain-containing protein n=1 Tax=Petromyces alliaceus TaxID=209559 RepID=A0A8H6E1C7_PETAA|nr:hypothetical protein ETB97_008560 [Aspergillus burnettii]